MEFDLSLSISSRIKENKFELAYKENGAFFIKYSGEIEDIADSLIVLGIIGQLTSDGKNVYLIINQKDLDKFIGGQIK